ncbi:MAG: biopolymer transporter ExbD [Phyllobacteriaceae bacterium]|nr:biopolymer transporter ExbD [Phyllobacteriaceae bacterium]
MLVLLVVFMITAPMLTAGIKVDLPRATTARPLAPSEPVAVTVARDGVIAVGREEVPRDALIARIRELVGDDTTRSVHVRGDRGAAYGEVVGVIDLLASAGFNHIALVSQSRELPSARSDAANPGSDGRTP